MICDLWAIDAEAGEAILWQDERWFMVSIDREWIPVELKSEAAVLRWAVSGPVVPVGRHYSSLLEASNAIRRISLAAIKAPGSLSAGEIVLLADDSAGEEPVVHQSEEYREKSLEVELREVVLLYTSPLNRYFERRGAPSSEVAYLSSEALRRISESGVLARDVSLRELAVFRIARSIYLEKGGGWTQIRSLPNIPQNSKLSLFKGKEWENNIKKISRDDLKCLAAWVGAKFNYKAMSLVLQRPAQELKEEVNRISSQLGWPPEGLRGEAIRQAYLQAVREDLQ